ncbi:MAG: phage head closure protein [Saprospiraceae bacterium]|nr:phage head closure protein [Saprospiraceae bacterium]
MAKKTTSGDMRWRIEIQQPSSTQDAYGQAVDAWATVACVWAKKENPLAGNTEKVFGDVETSVTRTHWIIHHRDGLQPTWRVKEGSTCYDIMNIHEQGYRETLLLITEKRI